jgi:anti-anti-sigma regulatory factor
MIERYENIAMFVVPNTLKHGTGSVEVFFSRVAALPAARRYVFDINGVTFIEPCGVIALLCAIRQCAERSGAQVLIKNLNEQIYPYLHRIVSFLVTETWPAGSRTLPEEAFRRQG